MSFEVIHGDCREVLEGRVFAGDTAVITDPPYGIAANEMTLGSGKKTFARGSDWDRTRPDVSFLLSLASKVCIWGGNYFTDVLPPTNHWLVWHKLNDGLSFSECEMAWTNFGRQVRHLSHHWSGEEKLHPTMKPLRVMEWCIAQAKLPDGALIIDPYCGSGTTGVAAIRAGYRFLGVEREAGYVEIARKRIGVAHSQMTLFGEAA